MVSYGLKSCAPKCEALVMYFYHIRKGDNVKICMQMMDLKSNKR